MGFLYFLRACTAVVTVILVGNSVGRTCDYQPCNGAQHTMCLYPPSLDKTAPQCSGYDAKAGLTDEYKKIILNKHNELRQKVALGKEPHQPPAANMMELSWDTETGEIAQTFVNGCGKDGLYHDRCRNLKNGTYVGQNSAGYTLQLKEGANRPLVLENMIQMWYDEVSDLSPTEVDRYSGYDLQRTGHYTELVWAETTLLGCGYREENKANDWCQPVSLTCNYAVGGNMKGRPVYLRGKPCSQCPTGTHCSDKYPGLCTK